VSCLSEFFSAIFFFSKLEIARCLGFPDSILVGSGLSFLFFRFGIQIPPPETTGPPPQQYPLFHSKTYPFPQLVSGGLAQTSDFMDERLSNSTNPLPPQRFVPCIGGQESSQSLTKVRTRLCPLPWSVDSVSSGIGGNFFLTGRITPGWRHKIRGVINPVSPLRCSGFPCIGVLPCTFPGVCDNYDL